MPSTASATTQPAIGTLLPTLGGTLGAYCAMPDGSVRAVIVAAPEHELTGQWGEYGLDVPAARGMCGMASTQAMAAAGSTLAQAVRALTIGGHSDWHIPSRAQLLHLYDNAPQLFDKAGWYWSSTQYSRGYASCQDFEYGYSYALGKDHEFRARPVRSIQLQHFTPSALAADIGEADTREILGTTAGAQV